MRNFCILFLLIIMSVGVSGQEQHTVTAAEKPDTTAPIVRIWQLKDDYSRLENYRLDTMQTSFQIYNPVMKQSFSSAYLGNLGLAARGNLYFENKNEVRYLFLYPFRPYMVLPSDNVYYNVRKPFSVLEYSSAGQDKLKREQMVRVLHSQNINRFNNLGLDIRMSTSEGQYLNQKGKFTNFRFFGSHIKGDYSAHASLALNSFKSGENGGLLNDSLFMETHEDEKTYDVNLTGANVFSRNLGFQVTQRYRFGKLTEYQDTSSTTGVRKIRERTAKTGSIIHTLEFDRNKRFYKDDISAASSPFYQHYYINSRHTYDSTFQRSVINTLQIMLDENPNRKKDFGARAFISHELVKYRFNQPPDTTITGGNDTVVHKITEQQYNNIYAGASLSHTVGGGWNWIFTGKLWLTGYRAGDMILSGKIDKYIQSGKGQTSITVGGSLTLTEPSYFMQHYASNHFMWENDFNKTKEIIAYGGIENEPLKFKLKGYLSTISDFIYIGTDTLPSQHHPLISIFSADLYKHFKLGPFNSIHRLVYQLPTDKNIIRVPDLSYYTSNFFAFSPVKNVLTTEIGFDLMYYTKYRGLAYMPSFGMFYHQDEKNIGNYPYIDIFITAKLKRTRFYIKYDHINSGLTGKDYFQVLHYPMPVRTFKFGLSWTFYD
jgi:hypothetical protein